MGGEKVGGRDERVKGVVGRRKVIWRTKQVAAAIVDLTMWPTIPRGSAM